jgi:hypothetical protein
LLTQAEKLEPKLGCKHEQTRAKTRAGSRPYPLKPDARQQLTNNRSPNVSGAKRTVRMGAMAV